MCMLTQDTNSFQVCLHHNFKCCLLSTFKKANNVIHNFTEINWTPKQKLVIFVIIIFLILHLSSLHCFLLSSLQGLLFLHRWVFSLSDFWSTGKFLLRCWRGWWAVVFCAEFLAPTNIEVLKFSRMDRKIEILSKYISGLNQLLYENVITPSLLQIKVQYSMILVSNSISCTLSLLEKWQW